MTNDPSRVVAHRLAASGGIPNHPRWPFVVYKRAVRLPRSLDPAAVFEDLFERNGWGDMWRDGIYDWVHYHSRTHEVLGIARNTLRSKLRTAGLAVEKQVGSDPDQGAQ